MNQNMNLMGIRAKKASDQKISTEKKDKVLRDYALLLGKEKKLIVKENIKDLEFAKNKGLKENLINRLLVNEKN